MVIPEEREGKSDGCQQFSQNTPSSTTSADTRIAGGRNQSNQDRKVISRFYCSSLLLNQNSNDFMSIFNIDYC